MESFFASLALFLVGSDDAISGDLKWMFDSLFDDMAWSGRCCRVAQLNFLVWSCLRNPALCWSGEVSRMHA